MDLSDEEKRKLSHIFRTTDFDRRNKWLEYQHVLKKIHSHMIVSYQGLALIDAQLVVEDRNIANGTISAFKGDMGPHLTQSYLWVLGAYEIIRTISQYSVSKQDAEIELFQGELREIKHKFERLRIPLAKFERARKNHGGYTYACPAFSTDLGTCWNISDSESISRRELSDDFLDIMRKMSLKID